MKSNIVYRNHLKESYGDLIMQTVSALSLHCLVSLEFVSKWFSFGLLVVLASQFSSAVIACKWSAGICGNTYNVVSYSASA